MESLQELLSQLNARLPELQWKMEQSNSVFSAQQLPRGLFRSNAVLNGDVCIAEIRADIETLKQQSTPNSAFFLAERIKQKIDVLVLLCQINSKRVKKEQNTPFSVSKLSTRQEWLHVLELDIERLKQQQQALILSLEHMTSNGNTELLLNLKRDLGEVEKRLTLAQETLSQAT